MKLRFKIRKSRTNPVHWWVADKLNYWVLMDNLTESEAKFIVKHLNRIRDKSQKRYTERLGLNK